MKNLYDLNAEIEALLDAVDENGEVTQETLEKLDELNLQTNTKLENIAKYIRNIEAENKIVESEIKRLTDRKKRNQNKIESLENYIKSYLLVAGIKKIDTDLFSFSFRKSDAVIITNELLIPDEFKKEKTEIALDKDTIKKLLRNGDAVPGAALEIRENLQIK